MKKRVCCLLAAICLGLPSIAKEGMWLPSLLTANMDDMKAMGLHLTAEDIYSVDHPSIKDAIVQFNGGCTASYISADGLLLTNHHCGYSAIQSHSTTEHDYLTDGFWALSGEEELPNKGFTAMTVVSIEDVTEKVRYGVSDTLNETQCLSAVDSNIRKIVNEVTAGTKFGAIVKPFYYGLKYYLFITLTYRDVRLVGAPPSTIGKFGSDTDNWMWPRHTGDFSLFRVYADKDNMPADYSPDNVPYHPEQYLHISLKGVQKGDFTMVYGFPGRTREYIPSFAVDYIMNKSNPARIRFRKESLAILGRTMSRSDEMRIRYAARYARISNYYKKWIGENKGLTRMRALEQKRGLEARLDSAIRKSGHVEYNTLLEDMNKLYTQAAPWSFARDCYVELRYYGPALLRFSAGFTDLIEAAENKDFGKSELHDMAGKKLEKWKRFLKNNDLETERKILAALLGVYAAAADEHMLPDEIAKAGRDYHNDFDAYIKNIFNKSAFADTIKMQSLLEKAKRGSVANLANDPIYLLSTGIERHYRTRVRPKLSEFNARIEKLQAMLMQAMMELLPDYKQYYPDANGTLRIAYGQVDGYDPMDAVKYDWRTTLQGVMEKDVPGNAEFDVPQKLEQLYAGRDYGLYGRDGEMNVCFVATNHTTGGNSGSPVLDADGRLVGLNFDRCWEGTMSDIYYDKSICRNISVDIRYVLFIIDKFAGAGYLVDEMHVLSGR